MDQYVRKGLWQENEDTFFYDSNYPDEMAAKYKESCVQEVGKEAYRILVSNTFGPENLDKFMNDHPEVITVAVGNSLSKESESPTFRVNANLIPISRREDMEFKYIYFFETYFRLNQVKVIGGIRAMYLFDKGYGKYYEEGTKLKNGDVVKPGGEYWDLEKMYLSKKDLYNEKLYDSLKERKLLANKAVDYKSQPFDAYENCDNAETTQCSETDITEWIKKRADTLISVHKINKSSKRLADKITDIGLLVKSTFKENDAWFCVSDISSHVCLASAVILSKVEEPVKNWIVLQEKKLAEYRLDNYYPTEESILNCIKRNKLSGRFPVAKDMPSVDVKEAEKMFSSTFPKWPFPTVWFSVKFSHCLKAWKSLSCVIRKGVCFLSYKHIQKYALPQLVGENVDGHYFDEEIVKGVKDLYAQDPDDIIWHSIKRGAVPAIETIQRMLRIESSGNSSIVKELGDIEDCISKKLMPACMVYHDRLLKKRASAKGYLYHAERFNVTRFLLDCGFEKKHIVDYVGKYFVKGGMLPDYFKRKYGSIADATIPPPCGHSCSTLQSNAYITEVRNTDARSVTGCPYKFMQSEELHELLTDMGISDDMAKDTIIRKATRMMEYKEACAATFKQLNGEMPSGHIIAKRPEDYFVSAATNLKERNSKKTAENAKAEKHKHIVIECDDDFTDDIQKELEEIEKEAIAKKPRVVEIAIDEEYDEDFEKQIMECESVASLTSSNDSS